MYLAELDATDLTEILKTATATKYITCLFSSAKKIITKENMFRFLVLQRMERKLEKNCKHFSDLSFFFCISKTVFKYPFHICSFVQHSTFIKVTITMTEDSSEKYFKILFDRSQYSGITNIGPVVELIKQPKRSDIITAFQRYADLK